MRLKRSFFFFFPSRATNRRALLFIWTFIYIASSSRREHHVHSFPVLPPPSSPSRRRRSRLPLETSPSSSSGKDEKKPSSAFKKRTQHWIVLVDDEEPIRKSVGKYLFEAGYEVTACADAMTALRICLTRKVKDTTTANTTATNNSPDDDPVLLESRFPDCIVSDVRMPGMDGVELLGRLRAHPKLVGVPAVLLTAKTRTEDRIAGYRAGADAYLTKPFDPAELLSIIDNAIERHETLNGENVPLERIEEDLEEIKTMLLKQGGGGVGNGWVEATDVFLKPDELRIVELLCQGLYNQEIANELGIAKRRIDSTLSVIYKKANVSNRMQLVRWALSTGIVEV